jgi:hypothetical protein
MDRKRQRIQIHRLKGNKNSFKGKKTTKKIVGTNYGKPVL